jgi:excisionase family DNA binding protein
MITLDAIRAVVREEVLAALGAPGAKPLTTAEACSYLGITRPTLYAWMKDRRIPTRRIHGNKGRLFFFRNELDEALRRYGRKASWQ